MNPEINIRVGITHKLLAASCAIFAASYQIYPNLTSWVGQVDVKISVILGIISLCIGFFNLDQMAIKSRKKEVLKYQDTLLGGRQFIITIGQFVFLLLALLGV